MSFRSFESQRNGGYGNKSTRAPRRGDLDEELVPRYQQAEAADMLSIVGYARLTEYGLAIDGMTGHAEVNRVLLSCSKLFVMLQGLQHYVPKIPRTAMLDGRIFPYAGA